MLSSVLALLLSGVSMAVFTFAYPTWKVAVYAVSMVLLSLSTGFFEFICAKRKGKKKPLLLAAIAAGGFAAVLSALTFLINNIILKAKASMTTTYIIVSILAVFYAVYFVIASRLNGKKVFPAVLSVILTAVIGFCPLYPGAVKDYRIAHAQKMAAPGNLSQFTKKERELVKNADFYVAPDGNDEADGSFEKPFATLEKARDAVRALDKSGRTGITVAVKAGEYRVSSLEFTSEDSGTKECPVTYCAYGDGEVVLNGGLTLRPDDFAPVDDDEMLGRLRDGAKSKVRCADLKEYGLTAEDWGKIYPYGSHNTNTRYDGDYEGDLY